MAKPIEIILLPEAEKFINDIEISARKKIFFAIRKTKLRIFGNWFKKLTSFITGAVVAEGGLTNTAWIGLIFILFIIALILVYSTVFKKKKQPEIQ